MTRFFRAPDGQEVPGGSRAATGGVRWTGPSADQKCNAPTAFGKALGPGKVGVSLAYHQIPVLNLFKS